MSKIDIDIKRLLESMMGFTFPMEDVEMPNHSQTAVWFVGQSIKKALNDQGLMYKDGEIRKIEKPDAPETDCGKTDELNDFQKYVDHIVADDKREAIGFCNICDGLLYQAGKILHPEYEQELERAYKTADEVQYKHGYEKGKEEAMKAQYHDFREGERSAARNVLEMINNGWGIGCIKALCEEKLDDED